MKQICILLTKYSDWISSLVYYIGGQGYTHSSIALGGQPTQFYSFNYRGFAVETTENTGVGESGAAASIALMFRIPSMSESRRESGIFLKTGRTTGIPVWEYYAVFSGCRCTGRIIISVLSLWQNSY